VTDGEGPWDSPTQHDDQHEIDPGDMSGEDPPTMRASETQRARARDAAIATQLANVSVNVVAKQPSTTLPPPPLQRQPARPAPSPSEPPTTVGKGLAAQPRVESKPVRNQPAESRATSTPVRNQPAESRATSTPVRNQPAESKPVRTQPDAKAVGFDADSVVVLDRVSGNMPIDHAPRRGESAAGGIVVVATGADGERVRKLCHKHGLLVPVMSSLAVVHDAMSIVVIGEPSPPAPERVVHVVRPALADDKLIDLLRALTSGRVVVDPPQPCKSNPRVADAARKLSTLSDRGAIEQTTIEAIAALTAADRAHCLFHDPATGALWSETRRRKGSDDRHAMGGLVGWAAQTGQMVHASPAGDDPRWLQELDDPDGKPQSRLLVQPIIGGDRRVHAVLAVARRWSHADFSPDEIAALASFAALAGPALDLAVAASPAQPRKARSTMPGVATSASALMSPRSPNDSRPPPVTARKPGSGTAPVPMANKQPAAHLLPIVDEATRVDDPSTAGGNADLYTTEPLRERTTDDRYATEPKAPRMGDDRFTTEPKPSERNLDDRSTMDAKRGDLADRSTAEPRRGERKVDDRYSAESITSLPAPPPVSQPPSVRDKRAATGPIATVDTRTDTRSGPVRARTASDGPLPKPRDGEPRELAVIANDDDAKRVHKLARKLRLELSTFPKVADAPAFYQIVTLGETWSGNDHRVAYAARSTISDEQLGDLLIALVHDRAVAPAAPITKPQTAAEARRSQLAFVGARKLAATTDLADAEAIAMATIQDLLDTDRAYCWFIEPNTGALWSEARKRSTGDDRRAIAGISGWVARTGRSANVSRASADPRWLGPLDDPEGDPHSQLLVQPLVRVDDRVHGVLIAARRARRPGFTETDASLFARFATLAAPLLEQIEVASHAQQMIGEDTSTRAPLPGAPDSPLQAIVRGTHPLARWIYLALGVLVGVIIGLLV
jgi:GAF domain-containing protein